MAKIGTMELVVILLVALIAIGPERLPQAARTLGRALRDFRKSMNEAAGELRKAEAAVDGLKAEIDDVSQAASRPASPKRTDDIQQEEEKHG